MVSPATSGYLSYPVTSKVKQHSTKKTNTAMKDYIESDNDVRLNQKDKKVFLQSHDYLMPEVLQIRSKGVACHAAIILSQRYKNSPVESSSVLLESPEDMKIFLCHSNLRIV